jgi:hypothetical protein
MKSKFCVYCSDCSDCKVVQTIGLELAENIGLATRRTT